MTNRFLWLPLDVTREEIAARLATMSEPEPTPCAPAWFSDELTQPWLPVLHDWEYEPRGVFGEPIEGAS